MTKTIGNQGSYSDVSQGGWIAPPGTAIPTGPLPTAWPTGWVELGFLTDKGVVENMARQKTKTWNWQGGSSGRSLYTQPEHSFNIECNEENSHVLRLSRPGAVFATSSGVNTTQLKAFTGSDYWMFGIDLVDPSGPVHKRYVVPLGDATPTGSITYAGSGLTIYAFTVDCYPMADGTLFIDLNDNIALAGDGLSGGGSGQAYGSGTYGTGTYG